MTSAGHPLRVFLCHARADRDRVHALYTRLTNDGVDAWLDKEKLLPGQDWELEIRKAVREADVVVVCLSKQFNQAGFRQKEVRLALDTAMEKPEGEIFIIPARLEECDNLESLRKWHWVDLFDEDGYEMLVRALQTRANSIGATLQMKKHRVTDVLVRSRKTEKPQETDFEKRKEQYQNTDISLTPLSRENGQYASIKIHNNRLDKTLYCRLAPKKIFWLKEDPKEKVPQWIDITDEINLERLPFSWHLGSMNSEEEILPDEDKIANLAKFESSGDFAGHTTFTFHGREPSQWSGKFRIQIEVLYRTGKTASVLKKPITVCMDIVDSTKKGFIYELVIWECEEEYWKEKQNRKPVIKDKAALKPKQLESKKVETNKPRRKPNTAIVVALIGFVGTIIAALLGSPMLEKWFTSVPISAASMTARPISHTPSFTPFITITTTPSLVPSNTPVLAEATPTFILSRPTIYTMQPGEFPFCIARRFNVDPQELLSLNGLEDGVMYSTPRSLKIPQTGSFPGDRALRSHPITYTVTSPDETFNSIACLFGDIWPEDIALQNGLSLNAKLKVGQVVQIP